MCSFVVFGFMLLVFVVIDFEIEGFCCLLRQPIY